MNNNEANNDANIRREENEQNTLYSPYEDISTFIYTVSHELKTPARQISIYADFIEEDNKSALLPQSVEDINSIRRICDEITYMVQKIMEYSKAGFKSIDVETVSISSLVQQCFDELMRGELNHSVSLSTKGLPDLFCDRFLLKLMVCNLLSNSIKFTRGRKNAKISVYSKISENSIELFFEDNGYGFEMKYAAKIFEAFQRLQNEGGVDGSGIGLATVKKIALRFGGDVSILGEPNVGCIASIKLPIAMLAKCTNTVENHNEIKIGIIGDFSGVYSYLERCKVASYMLAAEEINSQGGILGKQVSIIFKDDQSDLTLTKIYAQNLVEEERINVLMGSSLSPSRDVMTAVAEKARLLFFDTQQTEGGVSSHYTFCLSAMPEHQMYHMLSYLISKYGRKCYVIAADYNYGILSAEWVKYFVHQLGGEVVGTEYLDDKISCFDPIIDRVLQVNTDILFTILVFPNQDNFYLRWHERGLNYIPHASTMVAAVSSQNATFPPPILENTYIMASYIEELELKAAKAFTTNFRNRYDKSAIPYLGMDAETAYSSIYLYKLAAEYAGTTETEAVISALESGAISFNGPGGTVTVRGEDHHTARSASCFRINNNHEAEELFRIDDIYSDYVESRIESNFGVLGGIKGLGINMSHTQYNMLLDKIR